MSVGILYIGITTKEFLEEYCILLGKPMYGNICISLGKDKASITQRESKEESLK